MSTKINDTYFITDLYSHGQEHQLVTNSFVEFFLRKKNSQFLLNENYNIENKKSFFFKDSIFKRKPFKLFNRDFLKLINLILRLPYISLTKKKLVILGMSNIQYFWILLFCKFLNIKCYIILHSELEYLDTPKTHFQKLFKFSIKYLKGKSSFLVLSKHISPNEIIGNNYYKINHPLPSLTKTNAFSSKRNSHPNLAIVGLLSDSHKSCNKVYDLELLTMNMASFFAIGRNKGDFSIKKNSGLTFKIWNGQYTEADFNQAIENIDAFLFFFSPHCYKNTASGTIMDAIIYGKNILALNHPAITSAAYNYSGLYVFDTIEEMASFIKEKKLNDITNEYLEEYIDSRTLISNSNMDLKIIDEWLSN